MASSSRPSPGRDTGEAKPATDGTTGAKEPGGENASLRAAGIIGVLLAVAAVLVLYALVAIWPPAPPPALTGGTTATTGGTTATTGGTTTGTTIVVQPAPNPP